MPTTDYQPPRGTAAVFSGRWLRYQPTPWSRRFYEGYAGVLAGWSNGNPEFTIDQAAAAALSATFHAMADYVGEDWRTVAFDGHILTVTVPPSLGGGVHLIAPVGGRYLIGWGLAWQTVERGCCDRLAGVA